MNTQTDLSDLELSTRLTVMLDSRIAIKRLADQQPRDSLERELYLAEAERLADEARELEAILKLLKVG